MSIKPPDLLAECVAVLKLARGQLKDGGTFATHGPLYKRIVAVLKLVQKEKP